MHLNFKKVHLHGFMSFGDAEMVLSDSGYVLVSGINERGDDNSKSNGSGKSSIWEAISWVLTGETIRGTKDIVNIHTDDGCYVELWFDCDDKRYYLMRSKDSKQYKTNLKIVINDEDCSGKGIRDSEKLLEQYLPDLTPSLIGSVIILGQGLPCRFTNNTPSGRKEVLEKLSKSDFMIEDLKERISSRKQELSDKSRVAEDKILKSNSEMAVHSERVSELKRRLAELEDRTALIERIRYLEDSIKKRNDEYSELSNSISVSENQVQSYREEYIKLGVNLNAELEALSNKYEGELSDCRDAYIKYQASIDREKQEISRLEKITDICPTCGQKLPGVIRPDTTELKAQLDSDIVLCEKYKQKYSFVEQLYKKEKSDVVSDISSKKENISSKANLLKEEIARIDEKRAAVQRSLQGYNEELIKLKYSVEQMGNAIAEIENSIQDEERKIQDCNSEILYNNSMVGELKSHMEVISKFNTLITRDFRGYLLTNVIDYIDRKAKEYSLDVFGTEKIEFILDGNNLSISYDGKQYESLSGGERRKVDVIVQFAIRDMLCKFLSFSSNMIVIDEIFDNLDSIGCQQVLNLVSNRLNDVGSIYVVTHHSDSLAIPYDKEIVVVKSSTGVSKLR